MAEKPAIEELIQRELTHLPIESLAEVAHFIGYLKFKYGHAGREGAKIAKLGGLWKDIPFDVSDEDIRSVRKEVTQMVERRLRKLE